LFGAALLIMRKGRDVKSKRWQSGVNNAALAS